MENPINIIIPENLENCSLPSPELLKYYNGLSNREIWLEGEVGEYTTEIIKQIIEWNREDIRIEPEKRKPIILYIYSFGGDLDVCYSLIDTINCSLTPVYGVNLGRCCSAAAYIFISCHKRFMTKKATCLFHKGSASLAGTADQMEAQMKDYQDQIKGLTQLMKDFTKFTEEEIRQNLSTEWYVKTEEALEKGVCDRCLTTLDELWENEN